MEVLYGLLLLLFAVLGYVVYLLVKLRNPDDKNRSAELLLMQNQLQDLNQTLSKRMEENTNLVQDNSKAMQRSVAGQLQNSQELLDRISKDLQQVSRGQAENKASTDQVIKFTETLQSLERTLTNQKQRGSLGEAGLALILENMLGVPGELYELQYGFDSGEAVDAVIKAKDGIICIDAKFSLDNYRRLLTAQKNNEDVTVLERDFKNDLKKRIDETAKYIRTGEGTLGFALMYIPAEGIYYDLLINETGTGVNSKSLIEYANQKKVIIVSPMTLYAYLQTVLHGFNAFKIERQTEKIQKNVMKLKENLSRYDEYHLKLGNTLGTAVNHYNASRKKLVHIDRNVLKITGESADIDSMEVEKPIKD
jgi:DNA recombination protein RmuC